MTISKSGSSKLLRVNPINPRSLQDSTFLPCLSDSLRHVVIGCEGRVWPQNESPTNLRGGRPCASQWEMVTSGFQVAIAGMLSHFGTKNMFVLPSTRLSVTVSLSGNNGYADEVDLWR